MDNDRDRSNHIAIIGLAGGFPQSPSIEEFWRNLSQNRELISFFPDEANSSSTHNLVMKHPDYVCAKGILEKSCLFDNELFNYSVRESELMDPQGRKFLMWAWEALENAGYDPEQYDGLIGAFACCSVSSYLFFNLFPHLQIHAKAGTDEMLAVMGCDKDFLATRISYQLGLKGPSKTVQTACSSSLVTIHDACQSLLNYECDIALAGGVSITFPEKAGYLYIKDGINSQDGHCRPFDAASSGTVSGNGGGIIVLKRADEAIRDRDTIRSFIIGSAINNDGKDKMGFTAPSINGQAQVIAQAISNAGITPSEISYIEAHGTGTQLGDPIEIEALKQAFASSKDSSLRCFIGSVKANIGHLDAASGVAGLIKTVLCLENAEIPSLKHFKTPNPKIDFSSTPFSPVKETQFLNDRKTPLYAGVSSFGIGGTNAHVILEAAPKLPLSLENELLDVCPFSAFDPDRLQELLKRFVTFLKQTDECLRDIAYTLRVGRKQQGERVLFLCKSKTELISEIEIYCRTKILKENDHAPHALMQIAKRWMKGEKIKWHECDLLVGKRIQIPQYPFKLKSFYVEPLINKPATVPVPPTQAKKRTIYDEIESIWCGVLKLATASKEDDFFAFGGDSLLALELCDSIRQTFYIDISLRELLESPTLGQLQNRVSQVLLDSLEQLDERQTAEIQEFL